MASDKFLPFPSQTDRTSARLVRGHRFEPIKDGWLLLYEDNQTAPSESMVGELCIVRTDDGRVLVRILRKGRKPGRWDLLTGSGEQELDAALVWAEPVTMIVPFNPTPEQSALFGDIE